MQVKNEKVFSKKNYTGTSIDRIRASSCRQIVDSVLDGKEFDVARMESEAVVNANRSILRVNEGLSNDEIDWAFSQGVNIAKMALGIKD